MQIEITPLRERLVKVTLAGRLDVPGVDHVEKRFLDSLVPDGNSAVVDLSQVDFVASMGIRMIVSAARSLRAGRATLALYGVQPQVNQVFEIVSLRQIVAICSTEADAVAAIDSSPYLGSIQAKS